MRWTRWRMGTVLVAAVAALAACDDGGGPGSGAPLTLSFAVRSGSGQPSPALMGVPVTDADGNAIEIASAELVLREVEFERAEAVADCDSVEGSDDCEKVEEGPFVVALPVDATSPVVVLEAALPAGVWDEVEFDVHKLDDDDPRDVAFVQANPQYADFFDISIRVTGTWTPAGGSPTPFTFETDLNEEQEIEFPAPIEVVEGGPGVNVTFAVDLGLWFRDATGRLIDPASANKGGPNEGLVKENIKRSIEGFEDDDRDGREHS